MFLSNLLLALIVALALVVAKSDSKAFVDKDELYERFRDLEETRSLGENENDDDGDLGSRCGLFSGSDCNAGLDCFRGRCIPRKDCMKEKLEEFNASFDMDGYKKMIFGQAGVTQEELILAYRQNDGDERAFAASPQIQSLIRVVKEHSYALKPVTRIASQCSEAVPPRRLLEAKETSENQVRRLQTASPTAVPTTTPTNAPTIAGATNAPTVTGATNAPTVTGATPAPGAPKETAYYGVHFEFGLGFDASISFFWEEGIFEGGEDDITFMRVCGGVELGAGEEFSFLAFLSYIYSPDGLECGSILVDADGGLFFPYLGLGFGVCVTGDIRPAYLEFTLGSGIGAGAGMSFCGVVQL